MAKKKGKIYNKVWDEYLSGLGFVKGRIDYNNESHMVYLNTGFKNDPEISLFNKVYYNNATFRLCVSAIKKHCHGLGEYLTFKGLCTKDNPDFESAFEEYGQLILPQIIDKVFDELMKYHIIGIETEELASLILQDLGYKCRKPHLLEDFKGIDIFAKKDDKEIKVQVKSFSKVMRNNLDEILFQGSPSGLDRLKNVDLFCIFERKELVEAKKDDKKEIKNIYTQSWLLDASTIVGDIYKDDNKWYHMKITEDVLDTISFERMKILKQKSELKKNSGGEAKPLF